MDATIESECNDDEIEYCEEYSLDEQFITSLCNDSQQLEIEDCLNTDHNNDDGDDNGDNCYNMYETNYMTINHNIEEDRALETMPAAFEVVASDLPTVTVTEVEILLSSQYAVREYEVDSDCSVEIPYLDRCQGYVESEQEVGKVIEIPLTVSEVASSGHIATGRKRRMSKRKAKSHESVNRTKLNQEQKIDEARKPLWEFMLGILNKGGLRVMEWVNRPQGVFRILDGHSLTQLWVATRKKVCSDKFEFLARALRHYYSKGILKKVGRKKNMYQFGEKVTW